MGSVDFDNVERRVPSMTVPSRVVSQPPKPLFPALLSSPPTAPGNHRSFTVSMVLAFRECQIVGSAQCVVISNWLLSQRHVHPRVLHVFCGLRARFFLSLGSTAALFVCRGENQEAGFELPLQKRRRKSQRKTSVQLCS